MSKMIDFLAVSKYQKKIEIEGSLPDNERIVSRVYRMAWPSTLESGLISLISAADTMMVGTLGPWAISAVGAATQPRFLMLSAIFALNIAVTVIVSRRRGENDREAANKVLRQSITISTIIAVLLNSLGIIFAEPLIKMISGSEASYIQQSVDYFRIIAIGNMFYSLSITITAAQRGAGNTKIAMKTNLIANFINIIFNYLLINGIWIFPRLEVVGAALATTIGNVVALVLAIQSVRHEEDFLYLSFEGTWKVTKDILTQLWNLARSTALEQIFLRIGFITFAMMITRLGELEFATHMIVMNLMSISFSLGDGLSAASTSLVGQSLGARRKDLALINGKVTQRLGHIIAIIMVAFVVIFRKVLIGLFTSDLEVIKMGEPIMIILAVVIVFQITQVITNGSLRGAGDVGFVALESIVSITLMRPILTLTLAYFLNLGLTGAWLAIFTDQVFRYIASAWRYSSKKWLTIKL